MPRLLFYIRYYYLLANKILQEKMKDSQSTKGKTFSIWGGGGSLYIIPAATDFYLSEEAG